MIKLQTAYKESMKSRAVVFTWIAVGVCASMSCVIAAAFGQTGRRQHHAVRKLSSTVISNISNNNILPSGISWEVFVSQANKGNKDKGVLSVIIIIRRQQLVDCAECVFPRARSTVTGLFTS